MKTRFLLVSAIAVGFCSGVFFSHHTTSVIFDLANLKTLRGVITNVDLRNPHAYMFMDVTSCKVDNYAVELVSPATLYRVGLDRNALKPGTPISILTAHAQRNYTTSHPDVMARAKTQHFVLGGCITLPSGRKIEYEGGPACPTPVKPIPEEGILPGEGVR